MMKKGIWKSSKRQVISNASTKLLTKIRIFLLETASRIVHIYFSHVIYKVKNTYIINVFYSIFFYLLHKEININYLSIWVMGCYNCICTCLGSFFLAHPIAPRKRRKKEKQRQIVIWKHWWIKLNVHTAKQTGQLIICVSITSWLTRKLPDCY